jgi:hypothetical protein
MTTPQGVYEQFSDMREYVRLYTAIGLCIIPIIPSTKKPALTSWAEYQQRKPSPNELETWFTSNASQVDPGVAVITGRISENLVVIDFDELAAYSKFFAEPFYTTQEIESKTLVVKTARGIHVYLRSDSPIRSFNISELHVNVQGEGKYVLAPPSRHPDGTIYSFISSSRDILLIHSLHETLRSRIEALGCKIPSFMNPFTNVEEPIRLLPWRRFPPEVQAYFSPVKKGERATRAFQLASTMLNEWQFSDATTFEWLTARNDQNEEPLDTEEIEHAIVSAARGGYVYSKESFPQPKINDEDRQKAVDFLTHANLWQSFIELTSRWVSHDERTRRNIWRTYISAQTSDAMTHSLLGRDSIGKTWNSVNIARLVPDEYVWYLAGLSPTSLAHDFGQWDSNRKGFVITLDRKILLFLEPPSEVTLQKLKPILSHDRREVEYKFTDKSKGGGLRTVKTIVRGQPAFLMLGVKQHKGGEQTSRWFTETPEISRLKTRDVLLKAAAKQENPDAFEDDEQVRLWRDAYHVLAEQFPIKVKISYAGILATHWAIRGPESGRHFNMFCRLLKANAAFHMFQRTKDESGFILANEQDLDDVLNDFKDLAAPSFLGVSGDAFLLYKAIIGGELRLDVSYEDIARIARETFGGETPENTLREFYVRALRDAGLLREKEDHKGRRRRLYDVLERDIKEIGVFDDEQEVRRLVQSAVQPFQTDSQISTDE